MICIFHPFLAEHKNIYVGMHLASPHHKRRPKSGISRKSWMVSDADISDKTGKEKIAEIRMR